MENHKNQIRQFVVDSFLFGSDENIELDTSFMEEGIIDSTGILELVQYLEDTYAITVEDHELIPENLDSIRKIANFLDRKTSTAAVA